MDVRRARFVAAQLGRKPGRGAALARLLGPGDLPGGPWRVVDERTWRTGVTGPRAPWGERARAAGSVTAWRSFRDAGDRWLWAQLTPLASAADAGQALAEAGRRALPNPLSRAVAVATRDVAIDPVPGTAAVWAQEQHTGGLHGAGLTLLLAFAAGRWAGVLCLSGSPPWDWATAGQLAARQAAGLATG